MQDNHFVMLHDEKRCIGCQACTVACANVNNISKGYARLQVQIKGPNENGRYQFVRVSCQHCEDAPCVSVCPTGASHKDADGIVRVTHSKCLGCNYCVSACPYKVRFIDNKTKIADKCDFCAETRLSKGESPACVTVCPTNALIFGRLNSEEVQNWLTKHGDDVYRELKGNAGPSSLYRRKEIHKEV